MECGALSFMARIGPLPAKARTHRCCQEFNTPGPTIKSGLSRGGRGAQKSRRGRRWHQVSRLVAKIVLPMSTQTLDRFLAAAADFDASDLHLVAGVPPAFRVNGEIIIADEDALTETEIEQMAHSLLNEQQQKKFNQEWELCISLVHRTAGRVRATF